MSAIGTAISFITSIVLGIPDIFSLGKLFNLGVKTDEKWIQDTDGEWYYLDASCEKETGWIQGSYYYLDSSGGMAANKCIKDDDDHYYYVDGDGKMATGWNNIDGKEY